MSGHRPATARRVLQRGLMVLAQMAFARPAYAHPLHSTIAEIVEDRAHGTVRATIRVFADDFGTVVAKSTGGRVKRDAGVAWDAAALSYALSAFGLVDRTGRPLAMRSCGMRRTSDLLWICLEGATSDLSSLSVRDSFLCALFDDQVNVVQATIGGTRHSLLFTRGDKPKALE